MAQAQSEIIYRGTCPSPCPADVEYRKPPHYGDLHTTLSVCLPHFTESTWSWTWGRGGEGGVETSCGGQATWAITTNKRTLVRSGDPTGLHLTIGDKYRALVATTCLVEPHLDLDLSVSSCRCLWRNQRCVPSIVAPLNRYRGECGVSTNVQLSTTSITRSHAEQVTARHEARTMTCLEWIS